jgi:intein-encoded DNA endonuclease-like protein
MLWYSNYVIVSHFKEKLKAIHFTYSIWTRSVRNTYSYIGCLYAYSIQKIKDCKLILLKVHNFNFIIFMLVDFMRFRILIF